MYILYIYIRIIFNIYSQNICAYLRPVTSTTQEICRIKRHTCGFSGIFFGWQHQQTYWVVKRIINHRHFRFHPTFQAQGCFSSDAARTASLRAALHLALGPEVESHRSGDGSDESWSSGPVALTCGHSWYRPTTINGRYLGWFSILSFSCQPSKE